MKRLILAAVGAFVVTTSAHAVEPYAFGIKLGLSHNKLTNIPKAINREEDKTEVPFFNPGVLGSVYGEYAFHDMLGAGLESGFFYGRVLRVEDKVAPNAPATDTGKEKKKDYYSIRMSYIKLSPYLAIYPFGRENKEDLGIMYVNIGPDFYIPLPVTPSGVKDGKELAKAEADKILKKDDVKFGIGAGLAIGYEFSFGLTTELQGGYSFTNFFNKGDKKDGGAQTGQAQTVPSLFMAGKKDENSKLWNLGISLGYNFATLLEE